MEYNGWTNYATWRINLEIFNDMESSELACMSTDDLRDFVAELIEESSNEGLARDYAMSFIDDVNWYELAEHYKEDAEIEDKDNANISTDDIFGNDLMSTDSFGTPR